jgi:AmiR/NasT family two-component response regulator
VLLTGSESGAGLPDSPLLDGAADLRAVVHQAAGMVSVQSDCTITDALDLIRARAFADDQPIDEVSTRIVQRALRLD